MAKNQLTAVGQKKQFTSVPDILKSATQRGKLESYIDEAVKSKMKILDENNTIKSIREAAVEELGISPKMFNALVGTYFNNNFEQRFEEAEEMSATLYSLMQTERLSSDDE